jgi:DNA polymerase IV
VSEMVTSSPPLQRWAHIDINSYFATLIQQENPALRGRPIGVVKDAGRTCIIAASKEAKALGVGTGWSLKDALMKAPDLITVPAHFDMYLSATTKLKNLFDSLAPQVEIFSLDEAFINLSDCQDFYPDAHQFAAVTQQKIKDILGEWVTCNVGLSYTRLLAKMVSEVSPKGSIQEITPDNKDALLASVGFEAVCGIGFRLGERLSRLGVTVPYQINFITDQDLEQHFGPFWAVELRKIGQGEEPHLFTHQRRVEHMQSIGRSLTGFHMCNNETVIKRVMSNLISEVIHKARKMGLVGYRVSVSLRGALGDESRHWYREQRSTEPIRHTTKMFKIAYDQLYKSWQRPWPVIKISVRLSDLEPWLPSQQVLWPEWHRQEKIATAMDEINHKFGLFSVRSGNLLTSHLIKPEVTGFLGDKAYQLGRLQ